MSRIHLHFFKVPKIIFEFVHGVPDLLQNKLESLGIEVVGDMVSAPVYNSSYETSY